MDWKYFSLRRRTTLKDFVKDCQTEDEALQMFSEKGLTDVPLHELKEVFQARQVTYVDVPDESKGDMPLQKPSSGKKTVKNAVD